VDPREADEEVDEVRREVEVALVLVPEVVVVVQEDSREVEVVDFRREEGVVLEVAFREGADERLSLHFSLVDSWRYRLVWYMAAKGCSLDLIKKVVDFITCCVVLENQVSCKCLSLKHSSVCSSCYDSSLDSLVCF
jgi:hypothetical protein